jgi:hypothetical protein
VGVPRVRVETDDGRSETVDWSHCTSGDSLVVSMRDQGILGAGQPRFGS